MSPTLTENQAFTETIRQDIHETARQLSAGLGPTLVALLAGSRDRKAAHRWSKADGPEPHPDARKRLLAAHQIWVQLAGAESEYVARNWFIGANPRLEDRAPVECLRDGDIAKVTAAAAAFLSGTDD